MDVIVMRLVSAEDIKAARRAAATSPTIPGERSPVMSDRMAPSS